MVLFNFYNLVVTGSSLEKKVLISAKVEKENSIDKVKFIGEELLE